MANFAYLPEELVNAEHAFVMFDDFDWYISPHRWTATLTLPTWTSAPSA